MLNERTPDECEVSIQRSVEALLAMDMCEGCALTYTSAKYDIPLALVRATWVNGKELV